MRKLIKILIICFISGSLLILLHKPSLAEQQNMPAELQVIYNIVRNSNLEYQAEKLGQDYWKAPYETERDGGGDCEDLSIWLLDKLYELEYDAWLVMGYNYHSAHMWVRVRISNGRVSDFYDVDMTEKFIRYAYEEIKFEQRDLDKLEKVFERQLNYIKGE